MGVDVTESVRMWLEFDARMAMSFDRRPRGKMTTFSDLTSEVEAVLEAVAAEVGKVRDRESGGVWLV